MTGKKNPLESLGITTARDAAEQKGVGLLYFGESGSGKSFGVATAPNPLVMLTEKNGLKSIQQANPDCRVAITTTADQVRAVMMAAMNGSLAAAGIETLCVDGLTEVQRIFIDEIRGPDQRPMEIGDWGKLTEQMRRFCRCLRDLDIHVVCTALSTTEKDEATGHFRVWPAFQGRKLHSEVMQFFNAVGYCFKREQPEEGGGVSIEHRIMWQGPSRYAVKPCGSITGITSTNITEVINLLSMGE